MTARWSRRAPTWLAYQHVAEEFLAGRTLHPCPEADDYGGRCDDEKGACDPPKACQARVDCGKTAQAYWRSEACSRPGARVIPAGLAAGVPEHVVVLRRATPVAAPARP